MHFYKHTHWSYAKEDTNSTKNMSHIHSWGIVIILLVKKYNDNYYADKIFAINNDSVNPRACVRILLNDMTYSIS